jgi:hypothetical protein
LALLVLFAQYQAYRFHQTHASGGGAQAGHDPSWLLVIVLLLIILLPVIPISVINDRRWPTVMWGIGAGAAWLLGGVIVSMIALTVACRLLAKTPGWRRLPHSRMGVQAVFAVSAAHAVALMGFGVQCLCQARGSYGSVGVMAGPLLCGLVLLLTVLASKTLRMTWEWALLATILHVVFAVVLAVGVCAAWFALSS